MDATMPGSDVVLKSRIKMEHGLCCSFVVTEFQYVCGSCHNKFDTICDLHAHIQAHGLGGSYHYDHKCRTAFPKYDSTCAETQTRRMVENIHNNEESPSTGYDDEDTTSFDPAANRQEDRHLIVASKKFSNKFENDNTDANFTENQPLSKEGHTVVTDQSRKVKKRVKSKAGKRSNIKRIRSRLSWNSETDDVLRYLCLKCRLVFRSLKFLQIHMRKHEGDILCDCCDQSFDSLEELQKHLDDEEMKDLKAMGILQCSYCGLMVTELRGLKAHLCITTETGSKQEHFVRRFTKNSTHKHKESELIPVTQEVVAEALSHSKDMTVQCSNCLSRFENIYFLTKHSVVHKYGFKCSNCILCFMNETDRDLHLADFLNPSRKWKFVCSTCGKRSPTPSIHHIHQETHTTVKDHFCSLCGKAFKTKSSVREHMSRCSLLQSRERNFSCEVCGSKFFYDKVLKDHIKSVHIETRLFVCEICASSFKTKVSLKRHLKTHNEDRPTLSCDICGAGFKDRSAFGRHRKLHLQQPKHSCEYCGKQFSEIWNLKVHLRQHTGEKPYKCDSCGLGFTHNVSRKSHMKNCTRGIHIKSVQGMLP